MQGIFIIFLCIIIFSLITNKFRLPLMIAYIFSGLLIAVLSIFSKQEIDTEGLKIVGDLGLTFLLFIVGLKLDITSLKSMGNAFLLGIIKIIVIVGLGFAVSLAIGFNMTESIFIGMGLCFSSTIVIVKILSDKGEIDSLPGKISVGTLIIEDIVAVLCLIIINIVGGEEHLSKVITDLSINFIALAGIIYFISRYIIPKYIKYWAKSHELLMVISIFFAVFFAFLCEYFKFSAEVGAFIAGMMFAPYKEFRTLIASKLSSIRDLTLIFFFVYIGVNFKFSNFTAYISKIAIILLFVLLIKPIAAYVIMVIMKYKQTTSLKTGLILSQISEFALIITSIGIDKNLIDDNIMTILGTVLIISIFISSFLINGADPITNLFTAKFKFKDNKWQKEKSFESKNSIPISEYNNIILGADAFGIALYDYLEVNNKPIMAIDFNPVNVSEYRKEGKNVIYGDIFDIEFLNSLKLNKIKWLINTIPSTDHKKFINLLKKMGFNGFYAAKADMDTTKDDLTEAGANLVFEPYINAAKEAFQMIIDQNEKIHIERMKKAISKFRDHYIICGFGRMGKQVANDFMNENIPFVIVEDNPEHREELTEGIYYHIIGNASDDEILKSAGINYAKGLVAVYPTDEQNVFITLTARSLNSNLDIIARSILESNKDKLKKAGANKVISPYVFGGRKIASAVLRPTVFEFNEKTYHGNDYDIVFEELILTENSEFIGQTIGESNFRKKYGVTIVAIKRKEGELYPNPNFDMKFEQGDILVVIANQSDLNLLKENNDFILLNARALED